MIGQYAQKWQLDGVDKNLTATCVSGSVAPYQILKRPVSTCTKPEDG